jgi:hypothetical protein
MYVAALNLYDGSLGDGADVTQFRAGKTNNDIK